MKRREKSFTSNEPGQIIIIVAAALVVLLGFLGMATDIGYLRYQKREMQKAADAGAIAGASELGSSGSHIQAARLLAAKNGFTHNPPDVTIEVNKPPASGQYAGNNGYVEVIIHQDQPTFFMNVLGINEASDQQARAVAGADAEPGDGCIYSLSPGTKHSTLVNGGSELFVNCPIYNNSTTYDGFNAACDTEPTVVATSVCAAAGVTAKTIECTEPDPQLCDPVPDPFAYLEEPGERPYVCDYLKCEISNGVLKNCDFDADLVLDPGVYCDGIKVAKTSLVTFNPGVYIINGGGFIVTDSTVQSAVTGDPDDGVMFYNSGDATYDYGVITFAKDVDGPNAILRASSHSGDPYEGILFFQDHLNNRDAKISSGACTYFEGVLYFHSTTGEDTLLEYNGGDTTCAGEPSKMIIAGDVLHFQAGSTVLQGYPMPGGGGGGGGTPGLISLVE